MLQRAGIALLPERKLTLWATSLVIFLVDQITKCSALQCSATGEYRTLIPGWLGIIPLQNNGIALGVATSIADRGDALALAAITLVLIVFVTYFLYLHFDRDRVAHFGLALLLGGASGNIADRMRLGHVVDFLHINLSSGNCPVFNIADVAVLLSVLILIGRYKVN